MKHSRHSQNGRSPRIALVAALTVLCLQAGLAAGQDVTAPRLSQAVGEMAASASGVAELRQSLETLARSMERRPGEQYDRRNTPWPSAPGPVARHPGPLSGEPAPTRDGALSKPYDTAASHAISSLYSQLTVAQQRVPESTVTDVDDLRRAMQRFDVATDTVTSETFSRVLLGWSDLMMPTLSDDLMTHPRVSKDDLRKRVVDARLTTADAELASALAGHSGPSLRIAERGPSKGMRSDVASADITPRVDGGEIASLDGPVGELALSDMAAASDRNWVDTGATEQQYAMDDGLLLDEIELDGLGGGTIASLDSPVAADDLQETRAGFVLPNGVVIDLAVTRLTSVDGLDELHTIAQLPKGLDTEALSQISVGRFANTRVLSPNGGSMFTLIQNDLDNQVIRDFTFIDIGLKNTGVKARDLLPPSFRPADMISPEIR